MEFTSFRNAFYGLLLAAGLLLVYPLLHQQSAFLQAHFRTYHFFDQFLLTVPDSLNPASDTLSADSIVLDIPKYDGRIYLAPFFESLSRGEAQIRIGHFGDSSIEGDLITGSFRDSLQRRFGGQGVGMVPVVNPISGFRRSLLHTFSEDWYHCYIGKENEQELPRGISGEYFSTWIPPDTLKEGVDSLIVVVDSIALDTSDREEEVEEVHWAFFRGARLFEGTRSFPVSRLFYGAPVPDSTGLTYESGGVAVTAGATEGYYLLDGTAPLNVLPLSSTPTSRLRLQFELPPNQPVYGLSLESRNGIIVDNFPSRGNIGPALLYISTDMMKAYQSALDYDLIMLQFGLNALNPDMTDYRWYEREMMRTIRHFQEAMPGVAILIIGPSDRAIKIDGGMQSDPSVARVTATLRQAAEKTNVAFFSIYEAMGGAGSMINWVENQQPSLANKDYTHFNFAGAQAVAMLLLDFLLEEEME